MKARTRFFRTEWVCAHDGHIHWTGHGEELHAIDLRGAYLNAGMPRAATKYRSHQMIGGSRRGCRRPPLSGPIRRPGLAIIGDQSIRHRRDLLVEAAAGIRVLAFPARQIVFHEIAVRHAELWAHWGAQVVTDRKDQSGGVAASGEADPGRRRADILSVDRTEVAALIE